MNSDDSRDYKTFFTLMYCKLELKMAKVTGINKHLIKIYIRKTVGSSVVRVLSLQCHSLI